MDWKEDQQWLDMVENNLYPPKQFVFGNKINELLKEYDFRKKIVLDYGCGTGKVGLMAKSAGARVIGVDVSEKLLSVARKRIKVERLYTQKTDFDNDYFDFAFCLMVLHVAREPIPIIAELSRVLKPGGTLFVGIVHPFAASWNKSGEYFFDQSNYYKIHKRKWVFNLKNNARFQAAYYHRPLSFYYSVFAPYFMINQISEPTLPIRFLASKKYSPIEYLFLTGSKVTQSRKTNRFPDIR